MKLFEIYSETSSSVVGFLTEEEANQQEIFSMFSGPFEAEAEVELSQNEEKELNEQRYIWLA